MRNALIFVGIGGLIVILGAWYAFSIPTEDAQEERNVTLPPDSLLES